MSWDVSLEDRTAPHWCSYGTPPDQYVKQYPLDEPCTTPCYPAVQVERFQDGGTYAVGGSTEASLNITYNYSPFYYNHLDKENGLRFLNGKRAGDVIKALEYAVSALGTTRDNDYWASTPGNAGAALAVLLSWARQYPDAIFSVH